MYILYIYIYYIYINISTALGNEISQSSMLSLKCDHRFLCEFSILFSTSEP